MGHFNIVNSSFVKCECLFLTDESGNPLLVPILQVALAIKGDGSHKKLVVADDEHYVNLSGETWSDAENSSIKYEPQIAFHKLATDVILIGHGYTTKGSETETLVGLRIGPLQKVVRVVGDRYLFRRSGHVSVTSPLPFERIPLIYENAFGGWDRRKTSAFGNQFESRNPVGTGFRVTTIDLDDQVKLPNLEDPRRPYLAYGDTPPPVGFGFISPNWQPRSSFAGTYDEVWDRERKPLLPKDFDRRFFNAASSGLIAPGYLMGDELISVINASPEGKMSFSLPGIPSPRCKVCLHGGTEEIVQTVLDTVIINTDESLVYLIWRGYIAIRSGPHDVISVRVRARGPTDRKLA